MNALTLWHNPRCSKSREMLALLEAEGHAPKLRLYLKEPPERAELSDLIALLGLTPRSFIRKSDPAFKAAGLAPDLTDEAALDAMLAEPRLIQRPVVVWNNTARIGRPPAPLAELFD